MKYFYSTLLLSILGYPIFVFFVLIESLQKQSFEREFLTNIDTGLSYFYSYIKIIFFFVITFIAITLLISSFLEKYWYRRNGNKPAFLINCHKNIFFNLFFYLGILFFLTPFIFACFILLVQLLFY